MYFSIPAMISFFVCACKHLIPISKISEFHFGICTSPWNLRAADYLCGRGLSDVYVYGRMYQNIDLFKSVSTGYRTTVAISSTQC